MYVYACLSFGSHNKFLHKKQFWEKQFLGAAGPGCRACELHALQGAGLWTQVVSFMLKGLSERYVRSEGSGSAFGFTV